MMNLLLTVIIKHIFLLLLLTSSSSSSSSSVSSSSVPLSHEKVELQEEKTRLGSRPPSCHNKCNSCHPCWAVQVPTLPSHSIRQHHLILDSSNDKKKMKNKFDYEFYDSDMLTAASGSESGISSSNRYSNYKPLGWKCHCRGHLYNP